MSLIASSCFSVSPTVVTYLFSGHSCIYERVSIMKILTMRDMEREVHARTEMLEYLQLKEAQATRQKPFTHRDVGRLVAFYYKEPAVALKEARGELERSRAARTA